MSFFEAKQLTIISTNVGQSEARVDEAHVGWSHNKKSRLAKKIEEKRKKRKMARTTDRKGNKEIHVIMDKQLTGPERQLRCV